MEIWQNYVGNARWTSIPGEVATFIVTSRFGNGIQAPALVFRDDETLEIPLLFLTPGSAFTNFGTETFVVYWI